MVPLDFNNQPHMGIPGFASTHSLSSLVTCQLSSAATPAVPMSQTTPWPSWQPLLILHLELMPSFTCKWEPGKESLHPTLESLVSPASQETGDSSTRNKPPLTRCFYLGQHNCRNEREKTLDKVFQCLFLCLLPVKSQALIYNNHRVLIIDRHHPTPRTATDRSNLQQWFPHLRSLFEGALRPVGCCHPHPPLAAAPLCSSMAGDSPDLKNWGSWTIQNGSQIFFH